MHPEKLRRRNEKRRKNSKKTILYKCTYPNCSYSSARRFDYQGHERIHTNEKPFACLHPRCEFKARLKVQLNKHVENVHQKRIIKCDICDFSTTDGKKWKLHQFIHTRQKPFGCNLCDFACETESLLEKHVRKHKLSRKFACDVCDEQFESKSELNSHTKTHLTRNYEHLDPFRCTKCEYRARTKWMVKSHMLTHSKKKTFACWLCRVKCKQMPGLRSHLRLMHQTKLTKLDLTQRLLVKR